jgi:hypothetical protein
MKGRTKKKSKTPQDAKGNGAEDPSAYSHNAKFAAEHAEKLVAILRGEWWLSDELQRQLCLTVLYARHVLRFFDKSGRDEGARAYLNIGVACIQALEMLAEKSPDVLKQFVTPGSGWIVWTDGTAESIGRVKNQLRSLGVLPGGRTYSHETVEDGVALFLVKAIQQFQMFPDQWWTLYPPSKKPLPTRRAQKEKMLRDLKTLTRENYEKWWSFAEPLFLMYYGSDFENHEAFRRYGTGATYKKIPESDRRGRIRSDIKRRIKQAFKSIALR